MNNQEHLHEFDINELVWNESFRNWVLAPDSKTDAYWTAWLNANPDKVQLVEAARKVVVSLRVNEPYVSDETVQNEIQAVLDQISNPDEVPVRRAGVRSLFRQRSWAVGIAASLVLIALISILFFISKSAGENGASTVTYTELVRLSDQKLTETVNASNHTETVVLPDGSKITLQQHAKISYPASFANKAERNVYLTGVAFFEVAKDPTKPFIVNANGLITKVLGTKFWIRSAEKDSVATVEVVSGIVSVYSYLDNKKNETIKSKKLNALILTANQKATYSQDDKTLMATIVDKPVIVSDRQTDFRFLDAALDTVFSAIKKAYGIDVIYDEKSFAGRTLTATLNHMTLYEKMDIICKAINAHYEVIDGKIVVYRNS